MLFRSTPASVRRFLSSADAVQMLVSTGNLQSRIDQVMPRERPPAAEVSDADAAQASQGHARPALSSQYEAPRTDAERLLADVWAKMLGIDQVGIHDNFFELGGDSVVSIQIMAKLRATLRVDLPLRSLFDRPTVAELADAINALSWTAKPSTSKADDRERIEL